MPACQSCHFENPEGFRFCGQCGHRLAVVTASGQQTVETRILNLSQSHAVAERRHLSVMFCDLVNSTGLAEELDPEDLRDTVRAYQEVCSRIISRFEGSIAQYLGDGILAYFGYPLAHEDDGRRAVKAALEIVQEVAYLSQQLGRSGSSRLAVRIGIHTGLAVVGEVGAGVKRENLAVGQTPNVAARLQGLAEADGIVISEATQALVVGFFDLEPVGRHTLKGVSAPMHVFRVLGSSSAGRGTVAHVTPLVARQGPMAQLEEAWNRVEEGQGQVALIRGEAGIGKSRLLDAFKERIGERPYRLFEIGSSSYHQYSAFRPLVEALRQRLRRPVGKSMAARSRDRSPGSGEDPSVVSWEDLEDLLRRYHLLDQDSLALFGRLLSLPPSQETPLPPLPPNVLRQRTLELLVELSLRMAERRPLLMVAEDLHWMDPSTVELLGLLASRAGEARLLLVLTYRPSFQVPWEPPAAAVHLHLERLTTDEARDVVTAMPGGAQLPEEVVAALATKGDGNPLYLEELTRTFLESLEEKRAESGEVSLDDVVRTLAVPTRLHDSLMARLDRLGTAKEVVQLSATLGRSFGLDLLRAVSTLDREDLEMCLERLVEADLLVPLQGTSQAGYRFRHAMIQEAAYQALLLKQRRQYHWQVVQALEEEFPTAREREPELLAHHATEAQLFQKAIAYWQTAGQQAAERFANLEALRHLDRGLKLLEQYPESQERDCSELPYRLLQAPALMATQGFVAPAVEEVYLRARELSRAVADRSLNRAALRGLLRFHNARGELETVGSLSREMLRLGEESQDPEWIAEARWNLGASLWHRGRPAEALELLEPALAYFEEAEQRSGRGLGASPSAISPGTSCRLYCAYCLWFLGFPTRSLRTARENLELARKTSQPMDLTVAQVAVALIHLWRRDWPEAQAAAAEARSLARQHTIPHMKELALVLQGSALAATVGPGRGIEKMRQGRRGWEASGLGFARPLIRMLLAEALLRRAEGEADLEEAEELLGLAQEAAERTGEIYLLPEILRLQGELLVSRNADAQEAREAFEESLELAREQQARSLELRAATSLARLDADQLRNLEDVLESFTEGRETRDQLEAEELLAGDEAISGAVGAPV